MKMKNMTDAVSLAAAIRSGSISAETVTEQTLRRIAAMDGPLNCFTTVTAESAIADAREIDRKIARGEAVGPLAGVPFAVKNLFDVAGVVTLAGSKIARQSPPAIADATAVRRARQAGAVLVGATNMDEYAYGFTTENAHYGPTRNPHDVTKVSGGSSGGSAAAVAAGMVPLALGSDTNGSIRVPASFCGVFGLKPTFGRLSRKGAFPFVSSLDHVGAFAGTAHDLAEIYDALQGGDPTDPFCVDRARDLTVPQVEQSCDGLRIGVLGGWFREGAQTDALEAVDLVAEALGGAVSIELPEAERARAAAYCITAAEAGAFHLANLRARAADFDPGTRDRLIAGALMPAAFLQHAQRFRRWFRDYVAEVFKTVDILIAPATPFPAPPIGQKTMKLNGREVSVRANIGLYTQPLSLIGLPIVAAPVSRPDSLPLGVQIVARPWEEGLAIRVAARLEETGVIAAYRGRKDAA